MFLVPLRLCPRYCLRKVDRLPITSRLRTSDDHSDVVGDNLRMPLRCGICIRDQRMNCRKQATPSKAGIAVSNLMSAALTPPFGSSLDFFKGNKRCNRSTAPNLCQATHHSLPGRTTPTAVTGCWPTKKTANITSWTICVVSLTTYHFNISVKTGFI